MVQLRKCIREWESILQPMRCVSVYPFCIRLKIDVPGWISIKVTKIGMSFLIVFFFFRISGSSIRVWGCNEAAMAISREVLRFFGLRITVVEPTWSVGEVMETMKKMNGMVSYICWNSKHPLFFFGCFNGMIPNLYMGDGCFTKDPLWNGCLSFQEWNDIGLHRGNQSGTHSDFYTFLFGKLAV